MAKKASHKENKLIRCIKAPIRVLIRARDFYIHSMTQCAGRMDYGGAMGGPTAHVSAVLPKSFSVGSAKSSKADEDLRDLIRVASTRSLTNKVELELLRRQQSSSSTAEAGVVPRSQSCGIARIDEERPCEFAEEDVKVVNADHSYPRSRSYAVPSRGVLV